MPGSPIRTPWDHSSVDSSPRPIAASHVLHRLLVPRHSPFALDNLTTKMLASTVQFSTNDQPTTPSPTPATPPHTRGDIRYARPGHAWQPTKQTFHKPPKKQPPTAAVPSGPNRVLSASPSRTKTPFPPPPKEQLYQASQPLPRKNSPVSPPSEHPTTTLGQRGLHTTFR
jgi:hypothetical protein